MIDFTDRCVSYDTACVYVNDCLGRRVSMRTVKAGTETLQRFFYKDFLCIQQLRGTDNALFHSYVWDPTEPIATRPLIFLPAYSSPSKILEHPRRPQASKRPRHRQEPRAGRGDAAARAEAWMRRWEILHGVERQGETTLAVFPVLRGGRHPRRPLAGQRQRPPDKVDDLTHLYHKDFPQGVAVHPLGL